MINLLPKKEGCYFKLQMLLILSAVMIFLFLWRLTLDRKINVLTKNLVYLQKELKEIDLDVDKSFKKQRKMTKDINDLKKKKLDFVRMFQGTLRSVSNGVYLTQLSIRDHEVKITGKSRSIYSLREFVENLFKTECKDVSVIEKIERKDGEYNFMLLCKTA